MTDECEKCGIDLSEVADRRPQIDLTCQHDGTLGLRLHPNETKIKVHPGDALEIRWRLNYPSDGGPPTITEIGWDNGHWGEAQGDNDRAVPGGLASGGAVGPSGTALDSFADEGTSTGVTPDSFQKLTGYRAWVITDDDRLRSTAHREHVWTTDGPEIAVCQRERDGHHVSYELYRLREEAAALSDEDPRKVTIQANIDREVMNSRRSPERNCMCGIYAVHDSREITKRIGQQAGIVYGRVEAWGKVADYEKGFRAEKVSVAALFRPRGWKKRLQVKRIAKAYGVPVEPAPYKLPDPDYRWGLGANAFWLGFIAAGVTGVYLWGFLGYIAATMTYSLATFAVGALLDQRRF